MRGWFKFVLLLLAVNFAAGARAADPDPVFKARAEELVGVLNGTADLERVFSPAFLAQVPAAQVKQIGVQLTAAHGTARRVAAVTPAGPLAGTVSIDMERAVVRMEMRLGPAPPHFVEGLLVTGVEAKGGTVAGVAAQISSLPGEVSLAAARLGAGTPQLFLTRKAEQPLAIGSAFKLFILAELVREVKAGERRWTDVVPLGTPSLPSGFLQRWPKGAPLTLHSLAALMISQSDNTAADTLLAVLGREKVERLLPALGIHAPDRLRPFLSTREAFLLKAGPASLRTRWAAAGTAERRKMLAQELARGDVNAIDPGLFAEAPLAIAEVEWFASTADIVRALDWLRRSGDRSALAILAVNPGIPDLAGPYDYVGYKGGSEGGVLNLSFLLRRKDGVWLAASASWNDTAARLDEGRLIAAMSRLLALLAEGELPQQPSAAARP